MDNQNATENQPQPPITNRILSTGEIVRETFATYRRLFPFFLSLGIIYTIALWIYMLGTENKTPTWPDIGLRMLSGIIISYGTVANILALQENKNTVATIYGTSLRRFLPAMVVLVSLQLLINLGYIFLIIPGILFWVWYQFAPYVYLTEKIGMFKSFGRSRDLVEGHWWAVFGRMTFFTIGVAISVLLVGILAAFGPKEIALFVIYSVVGMFYLPLLCTFEFVLFKNLQKIYVPKKEEHVEEKQTEETPPKSE